MSIIDSLIKRSKVYSGLEDQIKALRKRSDLNLMSAQFDISAQWLSISSTLAYSTYDDVYSIVKFLAETEARIPFYGYRVVNDSAMKSYLKKDKNSIQGRYFQIKAMEDLPEEDLLVKFLNSFSYADRVLYGTMMRLAGEIFYWKYIEDVGPNTGAITWYPLNPSYVTLVVSDSLPRIVVKYKYNDGNNIIEFEPDEIVHIKYPNPDLTYRNQFRGVSPIQAALRRLTRIDANIEASTAQLQNGGLPGVVYEKDLDVTNKGTRRSDFAAFLNNPGNKGTPYWIDGELGYIQTGTTLADLQAAELAGIDFTKLCNIFSVPEQMMNNHTASTDNNMQWAEKRLYTNSIIPTLSYLRDAINSKAIPNIIGSYRRFADFDISEIPSLQEDMQKQAQALNTMWWVSGNEKRQIQKFDKATDPIMDQYIIPSGNQLLEDLSIPKDTTQGVDYGGTGAAQNGRQTNQAN